MAVGVLAVAAAWVADGSVLAALATGATVLVTGADVGPLEPEPAPAPVVLVGESAEDPAEDPEPVEAELVGDAAELVAEAAGATVEPSAEVTGDVAEPTAEPNPQPPTLACVSCAVHDVGQDLATSLRNVGHVVNDLAGLPAELLPAGWPGTAAAELFHHEADRLLPAATRFVDWALAGGDSRYSPRSSSKLA